MNDEHFDIRFLSSEQDFIYNFGVNRGHTITYAKVNRCYFLSAEAKQLYHNICDYAWGGKRECRPSQTTLRTELGWGRHSMDKYLAELREAALVITKQQGKMQPLVYQINELHRCNKIIHSEVVHQVREELAISGDVFLDALNAYRQTEFADADLVPHKEVVKEWFQDHVYGEPPKPQQSMVERMFPKPTTSFPRSGEVNAVGDLDSKKKPKASYDPDKADTWNSHHFTSYFCDLYHKQYNSLYQTAAKDVGQIARLVRERTELKADIREKMDLYFTLDYFTPKTLAGFCSSFTQAALDGYLKTGLLPEKSAKKKSNLALDLDTSGENFSFENERDSR